MHRIISILVFCLFSSGSALQSRAGSNVNPSQAFSWGANIGWINWRGGDVSGAHVSQFVCSGYLYAASVGWINLGSGNPQNGIYYQNNSASDFGVNLDSQGNLKGLAYSANLGWINFETNGTPRVDLRTGQLTGHAYSANAGWINLSTPSFILKVDSISPGLDSDNDGIPDAWELSHASSLTTLNSQSDADKDGRSDLQEYLADTDPLDASDNLRVIQFSTAQDRQTSRITWTTKPTRYYWLENRTNLSPETPWVDSGFGILTSESASFSLTLSNKLSSPQSYYRIRATRPLAPLAP